MGVDKDFLDRQLTSADPVDRKSSVRFATTTALPAYARVGNVITASANGALPAIDGVVPAAGNSLLLTDDGTASNIDNGIYEITQLGSGGTPFILTRRGDANANDLVNSGMRVAVEEGVQFQSGTEFVLVTPNPITLNTTPLDIVVVESGGGGGALTLVDSPKRIPAKTAMVVMEDVVIVDGGDLLVEGDLVSARTEDNYSILFVPSGSEKVVQELEEMFYTDDMTIDGTLTVDGQITDITPLPGLALGSTLPLVDGVAAVGVAVTASHEDHVHPADTRIPQLHDTTLVGTVQTTNAMPTTIATYATLANNRVIAMKVTVIGIDPSNPARAHFVAEVTILRDPGGVVSVLEDLFLKNYKDNPAWDLQFNVVGQSVAVDVVGFVGQTVEWRLIGGVSEHG